MTPETASVIVTIIVFVGTGFTSWVALRIRADITGIKVWTLENFVAKTDCNVRHADLRRD